MLLKQMFKHENFSNNNLTHKTYAEVLHFFSVTEQELVKAAA